MVRAEESNALSTVDGEEKVDAGSVRHMWESLQPGVRHLV